VYGNLDWARAEAQLASALRVAFAAQAVQRTKLAIVGHQAPGFLDFHPNPFVMSKTFGVVLQHVGLTEYIDTTLQAVTEAEVGEGGVLLVRRPNPKKNIIVWDPTP
jgi:hypothetical protein